MTSLTLTCHASSLLLPSPIPSTGSHSNLRHQTSTPGYDACKNQKLLQKVLPVASPSQDASDLHRTLGQNASARCVVPPQTPIQRTGMPHSPAGFPSAAGPERKAAAYARRNTYTSRKSRLRALACTSCRELDDLPGGPCSWGWRASVVMTSSFLLLPDRRRSPGFPVLSRNTNTSGHLGFRERASLNIGILSASIPCPSFCASSTSSTQARAQPSLLQLVTNNTRSQIFLISCSPDSSCIYSLRRGSPLAPHLAISASHLARASSIHARPRPSSVLS